MNVTEENMWKMGYPERLARMEGFVERVFRRPEILYVNNTCQFDEYGKYVASRFNEEGEEAAIPGGTFPGRL